MIKARQRRAVARMKLASSAASPQYDLLSGAVSDLEHAARLEPHSKTISKDLRAAMSARVRSLKLTRDGEDDMEAWEAIAVSDMVECETQSSSGGSPVGSVETEASNSVLADGKGDAPAAVRSKPDMEQRGGVQPSTEDVARSISSKAAATAPVGIALQRVKSKSTPPASALEFENRWKALMGHDVGRRELLSTLVPTGNVSARDSMRALFKSSMSGEMLFEILDVIFGNLVPENVEQSLRLLDGITGVDRFDMTLMLLGKKNIEVLGRRWRAASQEIDVVENEWWANVSTKYKKVL